MLSNELQNFLKEMFPKEAKRKIFTSEMKLFKDFGLENDEIEVFLKIYSNRFNVTISPNFSMENRFDVDKEGTWLEAIKTLILLVPYLILWFFGYYKSEEFKDLSFKELDEAIKKGVLE